ncbi:ABC transporter substrate-binding protein [Actinoallomurus sp. NBC_01490]|jgi:ABC-type nitrate/sulfonate/bicarbonate transport system substrate-binding protein|uniref:ABC transporter substrate-binding protein n=1 Tax=Actinoallomurus sp. NBC_01490 TaxID=2903557 RepID=UPI002E36A24C|nr:ABC transporter substrate-binding protein [Actinoallomurus sp. NBC_01490]
MRAEPQAAVGGRRGEPARARGRALLDALRWAEPASVVVVAVLAWEITSHVGLLPQRDFPPATQILSAFLTDIRQRELWIGVGASMRDSGITRPKDLEGKKIGLVQLENVNHAALLDWLTQHGVDTSKVKFVLVPVPDMPAALRSGQVNAGQVLYPLAQTMVNEVTAIVPNMMESFGAQPVQGYTIVSGKFATEHPDIVAKMQTALKKANDLLVADPNATVAAVHSLTGAPEQLLRASRLPAFGNDLKLQSSQEQVALMMKYGFLDKPVNLASLVFHQ